MPDGSPTYQPGPRDRTREPLAGRCLFRTKRIDEAEEHGSRLQAAHRLRVDRMRGFDAHINGASLRSVSVYYASYGMAQADIAASPLDAHFALVLPVRGVMRLRCRNGEFDVAAGRAAALIPPGEYFHMVWPEDFTHICFRIPVSALTRFAGRLMPDASERPFEFAPLIDRRPALAGLWGSARVICDVIDRVHPADSVSAVLAAHLDDHLMTSLLLTRPAGSDDASLSSNRGNCRRATHDALDLLEARPVLTVSELAAAVGVSVRSLQKGFDREVGMSPLAYMRRIRLERAHAELERAGPADGVTVADIAARWGFAHTGRFARHYRDRFDRNPAETLRSAG